MNTLLEKNFVAPTNFHAKTELLLAMQMAYIEMQTSFGMMMAETTTTDWMGRTTADWRYTS